MTSLRLAVVTVLTLIYTFKGGLRAAIWTDVLQQTIYVAGTVVALFTILHLVPGGWSTVREVAGQAGKFRLIDLSLESNHKIYLLVGPDRRSVSDHGKSRNRPVDRAAPAFSAQRTTVEGRA